MRILKVSPGGILEIKEIEDNLRACQDEVGGLIDIVEITDSIDLYVNDEFLLNGSKISLFLNDNLIVHGDCFFKSEHFEKDINYMYKKLRKIKVNGEWMLVWIQNI